MTLNGNPTSQLLLRISPEIKAALSEMAEDSRSTVSEICREALAERVEWYNDLDEL